MQQIGCYVEVDPTGDVDEVKAFMASTIVRTNENFFRETPLVWDYVTEPRVPYIYHRMILKTVRMIYG